MNVRFAFPADARRILVKGDPILVSQVVLNVFRNAIEALMQVARREIQVSCHSSGGHAILRVRDTGPGFTPEALGKIGMPFFTTQPDGLGMGISISLSIAAQHGGKLTFANADEKDGGGAIIELDLPALPEESP